MYTIFETLNKAVQEIRNYVEHNAGSLEYVAASVDTEPRESTASSMSFVTPSMPASEAPAAAVPSAAFQLEAEATHTGSAAEPKTSPKLSTVQLLAWRATATFLKNVNVTAEKVRAAQEFLQIVDPIFALETDPALKKLLAAYNAPPPKKDPPPKVLGRVVNRAVLGVQQHAWLEDVLMDSIHQEPKLCRTAFELKPKFFADKLNIINTQAQQLLTKLAVIEKEIKKSGSLDKIVEMLLSHLETFDTDAMAIVFNYEQQSMALKCKAAAHESTEATILQDLLAQEILSFLFAQACELQLDRVNSKRAFFGELTCIIDHDSFKAMHVSFIQRIFSLNSFELANTANPTRRLENLGQEITKLKDTCDKTQEEISKGSRLARQNAFLKKVTEKCDAFNQRILELQNPFSLDGSPKQRVVAR